MAEIKCCEKLSDRLPADMRWRSLRQGPLKAKNFTPHDPLSYSTL